MIGGLVDEIKDLQVLNVKENFFKTALNEETYVDTLLAYNRRRVANFEKERQDWLRRFEMVRVKPEEQHRSEWELRQLKDSIAILQKDLSDNRLRLFEERQQILKLQAENEQLERRGQMEQKAADVLISHCTPVEQTIVYNAGKKPGRNK